MAKIKSRALGESETVRPQSFEARVEAYCAANPTSQRPVLTRGAPQYSAWQKYFLWLGREPWAFRALRTYMIDQMTLPCELPQDFDANYRPLA